MLYKLLVFFEHIQDGIVIAQGPYFSGKYCLSLPVGQLSALNLADLLSCEGPLMHFWTVGMSVEGH